MFTTLTNCGYKFSPEPESSSVVSNSGTVSLLLVVSVSSVLDWGNELVFIGKAGEERGAWVTVKCSSSEVLRYRVLVSNS